MSLEEANIQEQIIESLFFDYLDKYMKLQYALEVCRPSFHTTYGRQLVDLLSSIACIYGNQGEDLMENHSDLLTTNACMKKISSEINSLAERIDNIKFEDAARVYTSISSKEYSDYVFDKLTDSDMYSEAISELDGLVWEFRKSSSTGSQILVVSDAETDRKHGPYLVWNEVGELTRICYYEQDEEIFSYTIHAGHVAMSGDFMSEQDLQPDEIREFDDKSKADISWSGAILGALTGLLLASAINKGKSKAVEEKVSVSLYHEKG